MLKSLLANAIWWASNAPTHRRFRVALREPGQTQERVLKRILGRNANTVFGRAHRFSEIRSVDEYRCRVPLSTYDDYAPFISRIQTGEPRVLTEARVLLLVPTSGSTKGEKLIPYTTDLQWEFNEAIAPWIFALFRARSELMAGSAYWSISPALRRERAGGAVPIGFDDDSAYLGRARKSLADATMAVPSELALVQDVESFRYLTLLFLLRCRNLRLISIWHPSFLMLLLDVLPVYWNSLVEDIAEGTMHPPGTLEAGLESRLRRRLYPDPRRAAELDAGRPIWPRLGLISCWANGHSSMHLDALRRAFPRATIQPKGLIATEAFVSFPLGDAMPVAVRSHFFEFVDEAGGTRLLHELESSRVYSVVVTTGGGLYRYQLRDRVEVTGFCGDTPSIRFIGKEDRVSDLCGEKLSEEFVTSLLGRICTLFRFRPGFAMLAPDTSSNPPGYTLFIQSDSAIPADFEHKLEIALRENPHYRYCIELSQLSPVKLFLVSGDASSVYLEQYRRQGQRLGNVKPTALSTLTNWSSTFRGSYRNTDRPGECSNHPDLFQTSGVRRGES